MPKRLIETDKQVHDTTKGRVLVETRFSEEFEVKHGTKQGYVLVPTLFTLFLTVVLITQQQEVKVGVYIRVRFDGGLH